MDYKDLGFIENVSETQSLFLEDAAGEDADRCDFVHNVGVLASQTREGVDHIEYYKCDDIEYAVIVFKCGHQIKVNIRHDSYTAIVRDIFRNI